MLLTPIDCCLNLLPIRSYDGKSYANFSDKTTCHGSYLNQILFCLSKSAQVFSRLDRKFEIGRFLYFDSVIYF